MIESKYSFVISLKRLHIVYIRHDAVALHGSELAETHLTGARSPSVRRSISPILYSSGSLESL